jgi:phosphoglucosamine mutase
MRAENFNLGGEQSGHIIFMDYATTGDGIISALHLLKLMTSSGKTLSKLASFMKEFPQKITSLPVKGKIPVAEIPLLEKEIKNCESSLGANGRIIVRYSGTEKKIRILIEADEQQKVVFWTNKISTIVKKELQ